MSRSGMTSGAGARGVRRRCPRWVRRGRVVLALAGMVVSGCGSSDEEVDPGPTRLDLEVEPDSLVMPAYPEPQAGRLVVLSDGIYNLDGTWQAEALACDDPPMLQVLAWREGTGTIVVMDFPVGADPVGEYPVVIGNDRLTERPPPFARVGVQQFEHSRAWAFQGWDGTVELTSHDGRTASGRFAVHLRELQSGDIELYAGVFDRVPIAARPDSGCAILGPQALVVDSTPPDSASPGRIPR